MWTFLFYPSIITKTKDYDFTKLSKLRAQLSTTERRGFQMNMPRIILVTINWINKLLPDRRSRRMAVEVSPSYFWSEVAENRAMEIFLLRLIGSAFPTICIAYVFSAWWYLLSTRAQKRGWHLKDLALVELHVHKSHFLPVHSPTFFATSEVAFDNQHGYYYTTHLSLAARSNSYSHVCSLNRFDLQVQPPLFRWNLWRMALSCTSQNPCCGLVLLACYISYLPRN